MRIFGDYGEFIEHDTEAHMLMVCTPSYLRSPNLLEYLSRWMIVEKWGCMHRCWLPGEKHLKWLAASMVISEGYVKKGIYLPDRKWSYAELTYIGNASSAEMFPMRKVQYGGYILPPWSGDNPQHRQLFEQAGIIFGETEEGYPIVSINGEDYLNVGLVLHDDGHVSLMYDDYLCYPLHKSRSLSTGEVIGYRAFILHKDTLMSPVVKCIWTKSSLQTDAKQMRINGRTGIYAYADINQLAVSGYCSPNYSHMDIVIAVVAASGKVIFHEFGWRASDVRIIAGFVCDWDNAWKQLKKLNELDYEGMEFPEDVQFAASLYDITKRSAGIVCTTDGIVEYVEWGGKRGMPGSWQNELLFWWQVDTPDWLDARSSKSFVVTDGTNQVLVNVD